MGDTMLHTTRNFNGVFEPFETVDWCSKDTERMSAFAQKVIVKLKRRVLGNRRLALQHRMEKWWCASVDMGNRITD
jgi:hypothetical protein